MKRRPKLIYCLVILAIIGSVSVPPATASSGNVKLLQGEELNDTELSKIEGKGLSGALWGATVGGVGGLVTYTVDVAWDVYVDGEDRSWNTSDASKSVAMGASGGFFFGLLTPTP